MDFGLCFVCVIVILYQSKVRAKVLHQLGSINDFFIFVGILIDNLRVCNQKVNLHSEQALQVSSPSLAIPPPMFQRPKYVHLS